MRSNAAFTAHDLSSRWSHLSAERACRWVCRQGDPFRRGQGWGRWRRGYQLLLSCQLLLC